MRRTETEDGCEFTAREELERIGKTFGCTEEIEAWMGKYTTEVHARTSLDEAIFQQSSRDWNTVHAMVDALRRMFGASMSHVGGLDFRRDRTTQTITGSIRADMVLLENTVSKNEKIRERANASAEQKREADRLAAETITSALGGMKP